MRLILLITFLVWNLFGAAAIFNGAFVKTLKDQLKLRETCQIRTGAADPSAGAGVEAPVCSLYLKTDDGALWRKTGAGDTSWTQDYNDVSKVITVASAGADYTTIQAALTANSTGGELFMVGPGTYVSDTIAFTAANQVVTGMSNKPSQTLVTQADANIVDFGAFTGCSVQNMKVNVTAATTSIATVTGSGSCTFFRVHVGMVSAAAIGTAAQPSCFGGTGTIKIVNGTIDYDHTGSHASAIKAAISVGAGSVYSIEDSTIDVDGANTSIATTVAYGASSGTISINRSDIDISDNGTSLAVGLAYISGSTTGEFWYNTVHTTNTTNDATGLYMAGTGTTRGSFNHVHVLAASGTANSIIIGAGTTHVSQFEDFIAADGYSNAGTLTFVSSLEDGNLTVSGIADIDTLKINDTNDSDLLSIIWNENDTAARTLNLLVGGADRSVSLAGNLTVEGASVLDQDLTRDANVRFNTVQLLDQSAPGYWNEIVFNGAPANNDNKSLSINMQNDDRIISLAGNLTIEGSATLDQDLTMDAAPTFASIQVTDNTTAAYDLLFESDSDTDALSADRTLTFDVHNSNRNVDIQGNLTIGNEFTVASTNAGEIDFTAAGKKLDIEDNAVVDQDLTTDADPTFHDGNFTGTVDVTSVVTAATGSSFGTLSVGDGYVTDSSGSLSFGDENVVTIGTFGAGATTVTGFKTALATKTNNYTITATDHTILVDATSNTVTITLPASAGISGKIYYIKCINATFEAKVDADGAETIDGGLIFYFTQIYHSIAIQSDGTNWHIISEMGV